MRGQRSAKKKFKQCFEKLVWNLSPVQGTRKGTFTEMHLHCQVMTHLDCNKTPTGEGISRVLLSYVTAVGRKKYSTGIRWSRSVSWHENAENKWDLQGRTKDLILVSFAFATPAADKGTKEVHAKETNNPVNEEISFILIFCVHQRPFSGILH